MRPQECCFQSDIRPKVKKSCWKLLFLQCFHASLTRKSHRLHTICWVSFVRTRIHSKNELFYTGSWREVRKPSGYLQPQSQSRHTAVSTWDRPAHSWLSKPMPLPSNTMSRSCYNLGKTLGSGRQDQGIHYNWWETNDSHNNILNHIQTHIQGYPHAYAHMHWVHEEIDQHRCSDHREDQPTQTVKHISREAQWGTMQSCACLQSGRQIHAS